MDHWLEERYHAKGDGPLEIQKNRRNLRINIEIVKKVKSVEEGPIEFI